MTTLPAGLRYLVGSYFHQDYDIYGSTAREVALAFQRDDPHQVDRAVQDVDQLLATNMNEGQLRELILEDYHGAYDPTLVGQTFRDWLLEIRAALVSEGG